MKLLKVGIKMFGLREGFRFWFSWNVKGPIQQFIWMNITHKIYCTYCGWHCNENCKHEKIAKKKDILKHWEKVRKEMDVVEEGKDGNCIYCGDEKGTEKIPNPDFSELSQWLVCKDCKEVIKYQHLLSIGNFSNNNKMVNEAVDKLDEIAKRTGKPIMCASINKTKDGYKPASIVFTGEK